MKFFFSRKWIFTLLLWVATAFSAAAQYDKDVFSFRGRRALADGKNAEAIHNFNILASLGRAPGFRHRDPAQSRLHLGLPLPGHRQQPNRQI